MAKQVGFQQREPRKIRPALFISVLSSLAFSSKCSFEILAAAMGLLSGKAVSKQAVAKRFTPACTDFLRHALFRVVGSVSQFSKARQSGAFETFSRVLIQDSTTLALHPRLADAFPGSRNQSGKSQALAKIQATYDLLTDQFVCFALSAFTRNDQTASREILNLACPGDLILRDLGYFVLEVLDQLQACGSFFLSRLRYDVTLLRENGQRLDLLRQLRRYGALDQVVLMGEKQKIQVRLVAAPLPQAQAATRRRKAKQNRDRRCRPSKEHLALLGWEIFVTNVPPKIWSAQTTCRIYGLRWRIETIFKAWKSHFHMADLPEGSAHQVHALLYARLLFICIFQTFFAAMAECFFYTYGRWLSLLRFSQFFAEHHSIIASLAQNEAGCEVLEAIILKHCCYDKRKCRLNFFEELQCLS